MKLSKKVLKDKGLYSAVSPRCKKVRKVRNDNGDFIDHSKDVAIEKYSNLVQKGKIVDEPIHDQYMPIQIQENTVHKVIPEQILIDSVQKNETSFGPCKQSSIKEDISPAVTPQRLNTNKLALDTTKLDDSR